MRSCLNLLRFFLALGVLPALSLATTYTAQILDTSAYSLLAHSINDKGQIVGSYNPGSGPSRGFLLDHGVLTTIDPPGIPANAEVRLSGINNSGVIVGNVEFTEVSAPTDYAFIDNQGSFAFYGPRTGYVATDFFAINNKGQILGQSFDAEFDAETAPTCRCTFIYQNGIATPVNVSGDVSDLNDAGQIVGTYLAGGHQNGYLYANGTSTTINSPISENTGLYAINNLGQIVGQADGYGPGGLLGSFLDDHGTFTGLSPFGDYFFATDINDLGQIVGFAYGTTLSDGHNLLLTPVPVPEPTSAVLLLIGGALVAAPQRRRLRSLHRNTRS